MGGEDQRPFGGPAASIQTTNEGTTVLCHECGELLEVKDPRALILTLHLRNECSISGLFNHQGSGE